ncbi:MAG: precorrin-2 C(20)-methyltransferase [Deltaproteobacteria bacterium]|nr:precorrin-2 C(20)-methyltransferase [Deltaproteobacteria bacterium]
MKKPSRKIGALYGIGVGPGDKELLTIKAIKTLMTADIIAVPASGSLDEGVAFSIVREFIGRKKLLKIFFPMTKDKKRLDAARTDAARKIARRLKASKDVAFITIGDPMFYSTFGYTARLVKGVLPEAKIVCVPGVSSLNASASAAAVPLAEADDAIAIIPATYGIERIRDALERFDTVVLMKVKTMMKGILKLLEETGLMGDAVFVSKATWPEEEVVKDMNTFKDNDPHYFSMVIIRKKENGSPI